MNWFEVKFSELSAVWLKNHFLAFHSRASCIGSLVGDLAKDVLHHIDLTVVVDRLIIKLVVDCWLCILMWLLHNLDIFFNFNLLNGPRNLLILQILLLR